MRYTYSFSVWPDEGWRFERPVYDLFRVLEPRAAMDFTEPEFERFRSGLSHGGLTLREIERIPFHEPEPVS